MDPFTLATGIKTTLDIAKTVKDITKDAELKVKTSELYDEIIKVQSGIIEVQAEHSKLQQDNHDLTQKLNSIETWEKEKEKYILKEICEKVFVFERKASEQGEEPIHWLCARCFNQNKKSILQLKLKANNGYHYMCHSCGREICDFSKEIPMEPGITYTNPFDRFNR